MLIAAFFFAFAFLIQLQQKLTFGLWFQISDLHHETFAIAAVAMGLVVLVGSAITKSGRLPNCLLSFLGYGVYDDLVSFSAPASVTSTVSSIRTPPYPGK